MPTDKTTLFAMVWLLPVITGVSSVLWAYLVKSSPGGFWLASGADVLSKVILFAALSNMVPSNAIAFSGNVPAVFIAEVLISSVITFLWIWPILHGVTLPTAALAEIGYPFFAVVVSYFVFRGQQITGLQIAGGIAVIAGSLLVSFGQPPH